jgi:hypothetical protein
LREPASKAQNRRTVERVNVSAVVELSGLDELIGVLRRRGFRVLGPTVRDGAIVYDELESAAELPVGWTDRQEAGTYRLERREDEARFGYAVGPHSWKQFLFPARLRLWRARKNGGAPVVEEEPLDETPLAFIGVRACELNAIAIQDKVFTGGKFVGSGCSAVGSLTTRSTSSTSAGPRRRSCSRSRGSRRTSSRSPCSGTTGGCGSGSRRHAGCAGATVAVRSLARSRGSSFRSTGTSSARC